MHMNGNQNTDIQTLLMASVHSKLQKNLHKAIKNKESICSKKEKPQS